MKTVGQNRKARFDYEILDTVLAGIILTGSEVKSCRAGHVDLAGAYVSFMGDVPTLKHMKISPYRYSSSTAHEIGRDRTLLLSKAETKKLKDAALQKGVSAVPLEVRAGRFIKILIGIGRGRKTIDKRKVIKEREVERRLRKGMD